jgi:hypothetical protein
MTTKAPRSEPSSSFQSGLTSRASPDARKAAVLAAIRTTGLIPYRAALSVGVAASTYYWWLDNDSDFVEKVAGAEAVFERRMAAIAVRSASQGSWQSALHVLERRFPERWGPHSRVDLRVDEPDEEDRMDDRYPTAEALEEAIAANRRAAIDNMTDEDLDALLAERRRERP